MDTDDAATLKAYPRLKSFLGLRKQHNMTDQSAELKQTYAQCRRQSAVLPGQSAASSSQGCARATESVMDPPWLLKEACAARGVPKAA